MKGLRFWSDPQALLRQAIAAWLILLLSVIAFSILASLLAFVVKNNETIVGIALVLTTPILVVSHVVLKQRGYRFSLIRQDIGCDTIVYPSSTSSTQAQGISQKQFEFTWEQLLTVHISDYRLAGKHTRQYVAREVLR